MREKQPSIEERILDIEMKMAETGPWPADFPASSEELAQFVRAVVREMIEDDPAAQEMIRRDLAGKNLACWCRLSDVCHGDVLLEIANREEK